MANSRGRRGIKSQQKKKQSSIVDYDADFIPLDPLDSEENDAKSLHQCKSANQSQLALVRDNRSSFFGLLDRNELEYFKNAESMLATNSLRGEDLQAFIDNLFVEAKNKELKIATNQIGSKLMERLVVAASESQLEQLCKAMEPFCVDLAYQKFSSHCLEAVILRAITIKSCENLVVSICSRLSQDVINLSHDTYGSHVLSTVLLTLSGQSVTLRSKKSQFARKHTEIETTKPEDYEVRPELRKAGIELLNKMLSQISVVDARKMAIDPAGSIVAQAVMVAEMQLASGYTFVNKILTDGSGFVSHCISDSIGSHFLETILKILPAKRVSKFVDTLSLPKLATSELESTRYLVQAIIGSSNLPKKKKIDLILGDLKPYLGSNTSLALAALETDFEKFAPLVTKALSDFDLCNSQRAALYERLSTYDAFVNQAVEYLIASDDSKVKDMGLDPTQSYIVQSLLTWQAPLIARRKLLNKLIHQIPHWAPNAFGSHIIDSFWSACYRLKFARERVACELLKLENQMKHSPYGRKVWNNWHMEKYLRKRNEWFNIVKQDEDKLRYLEEKESENKVTMDAKIATGIEARRKRLDNKDSGPRKNGNVSKKRKTV